MNQDKRPVTLEDLLRLKRAERPPPEFWNEFDRQLRAKQLAALVEKRPWWHGLQHVFLRFGRYHVVGGAAAVIAVVLVSKREMFSSATPPVATQGAVSILVSDANASQVAETRAGAPRVGGMKANQVATEDASEQVAVVGVLGASGRSLASNAMVSDAREPESVSPVEVITASALDVEPSSPSARFIAANFAAAQAGDTMTVPLLANSQGFESRALPARNTAVEPLQQISPPGEARRSSRYLAAMVSMTFDDHAPRTTERAASRISPEELYDQVRRFGTRQGGLNVKF